MSSYCECKSKDAHVKQTAYGSEFTCCSKKLGGCGKEYKEEKACPAISTFSYPSFGLGAAIKKSVITPVFTLQHGSQYEHYCGCCYFHKTVDWEMSYCPRCGQKY